MKTVKDVEIFAAGTHNGDSYTKDDLQTLVDSFYALKDELKVPVKLGHTSDEFNKELAKKIGVPKEIIDGEDGQGAIALGWLDNVRRKGTKLVADLKQVPDKVAQWIEDGLYRAVSCEIWQNYKSGDTTYPYALCGLALLGAELPAVRNIDGLDSASVYKAKAPDKVVEWVPEDEPILEGAVIKGLRRFFASFAKAEVPPALESEKISNTEEADVKEVALALGLAENAELPVILEAIKALKGTGEKQEKAEEAKPEETIQAAEKQFADEKAALQGEVQQFKDENASLRADIKAKDRDLKVMFYTDVAKAWTCLPGKPEEFGRKLADAEEIGRDVCEVLLQTYSQANETAKAAGLTKPVGVPDAPPTEHRFVAEVKQRMKDKGMEYAEALRECSYEFDGLYKDWRKTQQ